MARLYVMRHAKSSWAVPGARDFDRELNDRGKSDLVHVAQVLRDNQYVPELVLCSPATRTKQTLEGIVEALKPKPRIEFHPQLYSGGLEDYLKLVASSGNVRSVMTIGHNPMSGMLAAKLSQKGNDALLGEVATRFPTAAVAVIDLELYDWTKIADADGTLADLVLPSMFR